jgi:hypothetical protein
MDAGLRTPLLDFFRRGEVARDIRLLAAQGALAPRAHEQLGLLMLLVSDQDPEIAGAAESTLHAIPVEALAAFLARSDASAEMRSFFAARGIEPAATPAPDAETPFLHTAPEPGPGPEPERAGDDAAPVEGDADQARSSTLQKIAAMTVAQRLNLAMKGSREERAVLIRDPNKIVGVAVLSSPKLTETEVESIAKMTSISDELLRIVANTRAWVKNYGVTLALAKNPKTPVAVSMNLLARLNDRDLKTLSTDRNVPELLRLTARKKVVFDKK